MENNHSPGIPNPIFIKTVKGDKHMRKAATLLRGRITIYLTLVILFHLTSIAAYAASKIDVNKTDFDIGHIDEGLPAIANVHLKNVGDDDIVIEDVSCS